MPPYAAQARRLYYMGFCLSKLGNRDKAKKLWEEALKLKRVSRFETGYKFKDIKTIYYQAFCLRGLGRFEEADTYIKVINEFANSSSIINNEKLRAQLLKMSIAGLEKNIDNFEKYDSEVGFITSKIRFNAPEE